MWRQQKYWVIATLSGLVLVTLSSTIAWLSDWQAVKQYCLKRFLDVDNCLILGKPLWDWLDLLIAPIALVGISVVIDQILKTREKNREAEENRREKARLAQEAEQAKAKLQQEKEIANDRNRQEVFKDYIDQMTVLLTDDAWPKMREIPPFQLEEPDAYSKINGLRNAQAEEKRIIAIARARTFAVLKELDGVRKGSLTRFLIDSGALPYVDLSGADLSNANLRSAFLTDAQLMNIDLSNADLSNASFSGAHLEHSNLKGAILVRTSFVKANLEKSNLTDAILINTYLHNAILHQANFRNAILLKVDLSLAYLDATQLGEESDVILYGVKLPSHLEGITQSQDFSKIIPIVADRLHLSLEAAKEVIERVNPVELV